MLLVFARMIIRDHRPEVTSTYTIPMVVVHRIAVGIHLQLCKEKTAGAPIMLLAPAYPSVSARIVVPGMTATMR